MAKRIALICLLFFSVIFIAGWIISYFYSDQIKGAIIIEINKRLNVPAQVREIDFSIVKNFPEASVVFEDVFIPEKNKSYHDTLMYAKKVSFLFGITKIFNKDFHVSQIIIERSFFNLKTDKDGNNNYEIWKQDTVSGNQGKGEFKLEKVVLYKARIEYKNDLKQLEFLTDVNDGKFRGAFASQLYDLNAETDMEVYYFRSEGVNYIQRKHAGFSLSLNVNTLTKEYSIKSAELQLAELHFLVDGKLNTSPEGILANIHVSSPGSGPQALLSLMPHYNLNRADDFTYKGSVIFDMRINGLINKKNSPQVEINFSAADVTIKPKKGGESMRQISFKGKYTNNKSIGSASYLELKQFKAVLNGQPLKADLEVMDFESPFIRFNLQGAIDIGLLSEFVKLDTIEKASGMIHANIACSGKKGVLKTYKASGELSISKLNFLLKQKKAAFSDFNGTFSLDGNNVEMKNFTGKIGMSDFDLNGTFTNVFSFLLFPDQNLTVEASLISNELNLDELMEKKESIAKRDTTYKLHFSDKLRLNVNVHVNHLRFQKFESTELNGVVSLQNQVLSSTGIKFKSMEGSTLLKGIINASRVDSILISAEASIKKINITQLFYQMGNFGQEVIEDKNLKGNITANVQFVSTWSADLVCNTNKVYTNADIIIENGELINFEPTQALSKYIKGVDLRNIKFSTLKNKVEIKNRSINFATMEVKSSAMDILASGVHTFDNIVDYRIKLLLSQLLGKKVKDQNTEFGTIEDDGLGRTRIFIRMYGPMKNPKFSYDNKSVEDKIVNDIKNEKQNLKKVLSNEFGWFKKDTIASKKQENLNKKEEIQIDYEDEIEEK